MKKCPLCQRLIFYWEVHKDECPSRQWIIKQTGHYLHFKYGGQHQSPENFFCKKCWIVKQKKDYQYHKKNCNNINKKIKSITNPQQNTCRSLDFSTSPKIQLNLVTESKKNPQAEDDNVLGSLLTVSNGILKGFISEWMVNVKHLNYTAICNMLTHELLNSCVNLETKVPQLCIESLHKKYKNKLTDIIQKTTDVFNVEKVQADINKTTISDHLKTKIFKQFNQFLSDCKYEKRYKIEKGESRDRTIVLYWQLIAFVIALFKTKLMDKIHLGLDLLIVFQSGVRFPSTYSRLQKAILSIMTQKQNFVDVFQTKTKKWRTVFLSTSLKSLLIKFNWKGFYFKQWQFQKLRRFLNFSVISIRRGYYIQLLDYTQKYKKVKAQLLTEHSNFSITSIYVQQLILLYHQQFIENLIIPLTSDQLEKIKILHLIHKVQPKIIDSRIYRKQQLDNWGNFDFSLSSINQNRISETEVNLDLIAVVVDNQQETLQNFSNNNQVCTIEPSKKSDIHNTFLINGQNVTLGPHLFQYKGQCIYCRRNFIYPCICVTGGWSTTGLKCSGQNQWTTYKFPDKYNKKNYVEQVNKIRDLINYRGFYYVDQASTIQNSIEQIHLKIAFIPSKIAEKFLSFQYFPPITIKKYGTPFKANDSVGIFATQQIQKDVFIGQYAADIVHQDHLSGSKRIDTVMDLWRDFYIAPLARMGYVCLINGAQKGQANCLATKIVIGGQLRVIIVTKTSIKAGQQLLYVYSKGYFQQKVDFEQEMDNESNIESQQMIDSSKEIQEMQQIIQQENHKEGNLSTEQKMRQAQMFIKPSEERELANQSIISQLQQFEYDVMTINNAGNECYSNSLIQLLQPVIQPAFGTKNGYELLLKSLKQNLSGRQQDPCQMLLKNMIPQIENLIRFRKMITIKCQKCKHAIEQIEFTTSLIINFTENLTKSINKAAYDVIQGGKCPNCNQQQLKTKQNYVFQQFLLVQLKTLQFENFQYKKKSNKILGLEQLKYKKFRTIAFIRHIGSQSSGHYTCCIVAGKKIYEISDNKVYEHKNYIEPSVILLKQVSDIHGIFLTKDTVSGQILMVNKIYKTAKVASIVKLIIFNLALKNQFDLSEKKIYSLSKYHNSVYESSANLMEKNSYTIDSLLEAICTASGCDAARLLNQTIEDKLGTQCKLIFSQYCQEIDISQTIVGDKIGLENNFSCAADVVKLFQNTLLIKNWQRFFKSKMYQNTNALIGKGYVGKTGSNNGSYSFVGIKENIIICVLSAISRQSLWDLVEQLYIKSNQVRVLRM